MEECLQGRAASEGACGSAVSGAPPAFNFFAEENTFFQFVAQVLFTGSLFDDYFFPCHLPVSVLSPVSCFLCTSTVCVPPFALKEGSYFFQQEEEGMPRIPSCTRQRGWCFGIRISFATWRVVSAWVRLNIS